MARILRHRYLRDLLFAAGILLAIVSLILFPKESVEAAKSGLEVCQNVIIPSLFPFFVLSSLCVELGLIRYLGRLLEPLMQPLFHLSGACAVALALGMIGGYPVGAKTAIALYHGGHIGRDEAEHLLAFCNNSGPAFIFGVVGACVFQSGKIGILLFVCHIMASILVGLLLRFRRPKGNRRKVVLEQSDDVRFTTCFTKSVKEAFLSTLQICGFVIFFTVIIRILFVSGLMTHLILLLSQAMHLPGDLARSLLVGAIEMTSGVWSLQSAAASMEARLCMAAFILGWAGLCVHCQALSFLGDAGLSARRYILGKALHGGFSAGLTWLAVHFLPLRLPLAAYYAQQVTTLAELDFSTAFRASTGSAIAVWAIVCMLSVLIMRNTSGKRRQNLL